MSGGTPALVWAYTQKWDAGFPKVGITGDSPGEKPNLYGCKYLMYNEL
jgi:hypothetical protein